MLKKKKEKNQQDPQQYWTRLRQGQEWAKTRWTWFSGIACSDGCPNTDGGDEYF